MVKSHGPLLGKVTPRRPFADAIQRNSEAGGNAAYHGGPVMHRSTTYAIFWTGPERIMPTAFEAGIAHFMEAVAAWSGSHGNVYSVTAEYADTSAVAAYETDFGGAFQDTAPLPSDGCASALSEACTSGGQIEAELNGFVAAHGLPRNLQANYTVFLPPGYTTCSGKSCAYTDFCGYHNWLKGERDLTLYAVIPWATYAPYGYPLCAGSNTPNGYLALDSALDSVSHEQIEMITDPLASAWFDSRGNEIADKCVRFFGPPLGSTAFGEYNQQIGSNTYALQSEWSNAASGCVAHSDATPPPAPVNDQFANALTLKGTATERSTDTNFEATKEAGEPNHAGNEGGGSVWYSWTPQKLGTATIGTAGSSFDTLLGVYTGASISSLREVASDDDYFGIAPQSRVSFVARPGVTYRIAVDGFAAFGEPTGGDVRLGLSERPAPDTRISGRHRIVTRRRRVRARFRLRANPPVRRFECRIDHRPFHRCGRRTIVAARVGHHVLRARAIDGSNLRDPVPARFAFSVKRR